MTDTAGMSQAETPAAAPAEGPVPRARRAADARRGLLFILSSPSGAGKSTLSRRILANDEAFEFSISATTRAPRPGEEDGREYHFLDRGRFEAMIEAGEFLEHAEVFGNLYGTPRAPVEAALAAGRDVIFDVDWQGGQQLRNSVLKDAVVSVFILPPSIAELERRLRARGQDSAEVIGGRMARAMDEISHWDAYDYVLINDDLERCETEIRRILAAERLARARRPGLVGFVQALNREFQERMR
ncbi:guanylate kinase [Albimonas sp. CAU 1670]|uniref:guanylate kinase n=1 Tax=Albimonas sp. CAU 1670 TaxID=3032599 RepID=UPI0023DC7F1E|nr:guanylate kinase [Albimonas sp. CAU 1670]MDF2232112.1 guanylate kinase [Albimonas sp. CAU 1670]